MSSACASFCRPLDGLKSGATESLREALLVEESPGPIEAKEKKTMTEPATGRLLKWAAIDINDALPGGQKRISEQEIEIHAGAPGYSEAQKHCRSLGERGAPAP